MERIGPSELNGTAAELARAAFGEVTQLRGLSLIREGPRSRVYRAAIETGTGQERTAILKQITDAGECGFTDWASLQFLTGTSLAEGIAPRFLAGDPEARCFMMEDLGASRTLEEPLQGSDPAATLAALEALAVTYARLHALPVDEVEWREVRRSLPAHHSLGRTTEAGRLIQEHPKLQAWAEALQIEATFFDTTALRPVVLSYTEPKPFLAFTHGDPAPTNNHFSPAGVRLLDFEYGEFRHALYDLTAWNILCPLPEPVVERMRAAYRAELARSRPEAAGPAFDAGWAEMCVYRALAMLTWVSPTVLEANRPWVGEWSAREAVLAAVGRMHAAAVPHAHLAGIASFAETMVSRLEARWPDYRNLVVPFPGLRSPGT